MKKVVCCLSTLLIVLLLAGCNPADVRATDEAANQLATITGKSEGDFTQRTANRVGNNMCEGSRLQLP